MVTLAQVDLWDTPIGAVAWDASRGYATFEFTPEYYQRAWDVAPLMMPKAQRQVYSFPNLPGETFLGLPGMLADALPDRFGTEVLDAWLARQGRSIDEINPVERLLYMGKRGMGALEFQPVMKDLPATEEPMEIEELVKVASEVVKQREGLQVPFEEPDEEAMAQLIQVGTSAGGARAKAVIALNPNTNEVRSGQINLPPGFEHWIIKFDGVDQKNLKDPMGYGKVEYAYYRMAIDCGINMTECRILPEKNRSHFITRRFDRVDGQKIHLQSLCAIGHYDFNNPNVYSYEQAFQVMRRMKLPFADAEELYRRMVFNVIACNCDDHTKNIGFLMDRDGTWKLSPAYDMTFAYNPTGKWTSRHQLSVNGKREDIRREDLLEVGKKMSVKKAKDIIQRTLDVVSNWADFAEEAKVPDDHSSKIGGYHKTDL